MAKRLLSGKPSVGPVQTLSEFLAEAKHRPLSFKQRQLLVDTAKVVLEQFYVHLPFKCAMHGIDPVRRLTLLKERLGELPQDDDIPFHREMQSIFDSVRDRHTSYGLPEPYSQRVAFLPFQIEAFLTTLRGKPVRKFIISNLVTDASQVARSQKIRRGDLLRSEHVRQFFVDHPDLVKPGSKPRKASGVEVTHWNGVPIDLAVDALAARLPGASLDARWALAMSRLTLRSLKRSLPPDEHWVTVGYKRPNGKQAEFRAAWLVFIPPEAPIPAAVPELDLPSGLSLSARGIDGEGDMTTRAGLQLYRPDRRIKEISGVPADMSKLPSIFDARNVTNGYRLIRIRTFARDNFNAVVNEFARLVHEAREAPGLIIDVRANPGGKIPAGERMLQVVSPRMIEPERFQMIVSEQTKRLAKASTQYNRWHPSMARAAQTGAVFSAAFPLSIEEGRDDKCNDIGQLHDGPVVLIVDPLSYSTADMFAAGFHDHGVGLIIATGGGQTGGGGASNVLHTDLEEAFANPRPNSSRAKSPFPKSHGVQWPDGARFDLALRRSLRVGRAAETELEEFGISADRRYPMTRNDLLKSNKDLYAYAAKMLDKLVTKGSRLTVTAERNENNSVKLTFDVFKIDRVEVRFENPVFRRKKEIWVTELIRTYSGRDLHRSDCCTIEPRRQPPQRIRVLGFKRAQREIVSNRLLTWWNGRYGPNILPVEGSLE